jgi:hypothetical protein
VTTPDAGADICERISNRIAQLSGRCEQRTDGVKTPRLEYPPPLKLG